jgi:hypothetical protein
MPFNLRSAAILLFILAATGTANGQNSPVRKKELEAFTIRVRDDLNVPEFQLGQSPANVWKALPAVFEELGYPGSPSSSNEYVFLTPYMNIRGRLYDGERNSKYLDCGNSPSGMPAADIYDVTFVIVTMVETHPEGGTRLRVLIDGNARDKVLNNNSVPCRGKGLLEGGIAQFLDQRSGQ